MEEINNQKDKCVLCKCETPYAKYEDVNKRSWYVDGAGQLCYDCWKETYGCQCPK